MTANAVWRHCLICEKEATVSLIPVLASSVQRPYNKKGTYCLSVIIKMVWAFLFPKMIPEDTHDIAK